MSKTTNRGLKLKKTNQVWGRVFDYIENNIDAELSIGELCTITK